MAVFTSKITVTTTDGVVREHNYNDSTREAADAKTDALFANILASVENKGGAVMLANPQVIYMLDHVVSIQSDLFVSL